MQSVNGSVIMTIASSFGISAALTQTGAVISALHWMFFFCNCRGLLLYTHFNYSRTHAPVFIRLTDLFMETRPNQSEQASNHPQETPRLLRSIQINEMPRRMLWQMHCSQLVSGWWFQIFSIFTSIWGRFPIWLIFFKWVASNTNQVCVLVPLVCFACSTLEQPC